MSTANASPSLRFPESLQRQLADYRRTVRRRKVGEAVAVSIFGLLVAFLCLFLLDRLTETAASVRWLLFSLALLAGMVLPLQVYRWVWRYRRPDQLARLLARRMPRLGDQLLGVIDLVGSPAEQARSPELCRAAVTQVAADAQGQDLSHASPPARRRLWQSLALIAVLGAVTLAGLFPIPAGNAALRLFAPWRDTPRFTFANFTPLPERLIVPHGEPFQLNVQLTESTRRRPAQGQLQLGRQPVLITTVQDPGHYSFELPPMVEASDLWVWIGDARQRVRVEPTLRPELTSIEADVSLPEYLQREDRERFDVRGGSVTLVKGSEAVFSVTADRTLASARVDQQSQQPQGARVASLPVLIQESRSLEFDWEDELGLRGQDPLTVSISARDDQAPVVVVEGLPRKRVVLDSEQLTFQIQARDDFGLRRVGLEWQGIHDGAIPEPAQGERILAAGTPTKDQLEATGTFSAKTLGIDPQLLEVRVFVEDYFPGRPRVYSAPSLLFVLDPEQHAIWLTEQLSKWHRQSLEVRDRERQLYENNKRLHGLSPDELDREETRREIAGQAAAERANGRRLSGLTQAGEDLLQQASRNPEFGVGYLESWSEMLQILKDIAANRMPSVADLLADAAEAPKSGTGQPSGPAAGHVRTAAGGGSASQTSEEEKQKPAVSPPTLVDLESSQQPSSSVDEQESQAKKPSSPSLRLPSTTLMGGAGQGQGEPCLPGESVDQAVEQQRDLLAEFERIADELERVLGNMEGSTLVKRLKAASRLQAKLADQTNGQLETAFGESSAVKAKSADTGTLLATISEEHEQCSRDVSLIMDDMDAFYQRRRLVKFKEILAEMRDEDAVGGLRQLGETVSSDIGTTMTLSEFWSDTLDRWAEDLVDPSNCGQCPGGKSPASLPPSIVLEVLQILEGEVDLREETRVVEQSRGVEEAERHGEQADRLAETQKVLRERTDRVVEQIQELPNSDREFGKEIQLLRLVSSVMDETVQILSRPETGVPAIAAETEVIELLLQSKRINPNGGGGGGDSPGGGGQGEAVDSAIALLGSGTNEQEVRLDRQVSQATGATTSNLPEEYRSGLDSYFNGLEQIPRSQ